MCWRGGGAEEWKPNLVCGSPVPISMLVGYLNRQWLTCCHCQVSWRLPYHRSYSKLLNQRCSISYHSLCCRCSSWHISRSAANYLIHNWLNLSPKLFCQIPCRDDCSERCKWSFMMCLGSKNRWSDFGLTYIQEFFNGCLSTPLCWWCFHALYVTVKCIVDEGYSV